MTTKPEEPTQDQTERGPIPYERFQQVIGERNAERAAHEQAQAELERLTEEQRALGEQVSRLTGERDGAREHALRLRVAYQRGLPLDLADRLAGKDESELLADADRLLRFVKPASPGVPPPTSPGAIAVTDLAGLTPSQIREKRAEILKQALGK